VIEFPSGWQKEPKPRPFGSVYRRSGSTKLHVKFEYGGRTVRKSTGLEDTKKHREAARAFLDRIGAAIADGTFRFSEAFPAATEEERAHFGKLEGASALRRCGPEAVTFGEYLDGWIKGSLDADPSATKRRDYGQVIRCHLQPRFGEMTFERLTGVEVVHFVRELRARGLSTSRIRNVLIPLRIVWEDGCVENGWDLANPFEHLKRRNRSGKLIPRRQKNPPDVFRFEEWTRFLEAIEPWYRPVAELQVMTGMIASEVARVTREDAACRRLRVRGTKTEHRPRELPVSPALRRVLDELAARTTGDFLATHPDGSPLRARVFWTAWKNGLKRAGLSYRRPYAARHTFAIWSLVSGTHPERLVPLMGHASKQMVYEVYGRYTEGLEEDAAAIRAYLKGSPVAEKDQPPELRLSTEDTVEGTVEATEGRYGA
jgi:integrase